MSLDDYPRGVSFIPEISHWTGYFFLHLVKRDGNKLLVPKEIEWVEQPESLVNPNAAVYSSNRAAAQKLFDDLYALGFRPSDGKNNDAVIKAKDDHLADLRRIIFDKDKPQSSPGF